MVPLAEAKRERVALAKAIYRRLWRLLCLVSMI